MDTPNTQMYGRSLSWFDTPNTQMHGRSLSWFDTSNTQMYGRSFYDFDIRFCSDSVVFVCFSF